MNVRRHQQELENYREISSIKKMRDNLIKNSIVVVWFLISYYLPVIFGGQRDPLCQANMILVNNIFGFLLFGLMAFFCLLNIILFHWAKNRYYGIDAQNFMKKNLLFCSLLIFIVYTFGLGGWFFGVQSLWPKFDS